MDDADGYFPERVAATCCDRWEDWDRKPFTGESPKHVSVWEKA